MHEFADESGADLLVVGTSEHRPIGPVAPGNTVERLLNGAPCAVAVAPRGYRERSSPIRDIAVAYEGSPESEQATDVAVQLAQRLEASLRLVAVAPKPDDRLQGDSGISLGGHAGTSRRRPSISPRLYNQDLAPTETAGRRWRSYNIFTCGPTT